MAVKPIIAGVLAVGVAGGIYAAFTNFSGHRSEVGDQLAEMAANGNAELPIMVDAGTRLDAMEATADDTFEYHYTFVDLETSQIDRDAFQQRLASQLKQTVCTDSGTEVFRANRVNLVYSYYGSDGEQVGSVVIPTSECAASA